MNFVVMSGCSCRWHSTLSSLYSISASTPNILGFLRKATTKLEIIVSSFQWTLDSVAMSEIRATTMRRRHHLLEIGSFY